MVDNVHVNRLDLGAEAGLQIVAEKGIVLVYRGFWCFGQVILKLIMNLYD